MGCIVRTARRHGSWIVVLAAVLAPVLVGVACGDEKPPEETPCTVTCSTSSACPLALQYTCSAGGGCYDSESSCLTACCPPK